MTQEFIQIRAAE
uniref:Uncharacterized protein n=1 Tax=Arundo donax TaxID=35708 RepID=A0A0A9BD30_ARUDO